jgi:hypothetical protein
MEPPGRGQKGYFQGAPLKILLQQLPDYLATASHQKQNFWTKFYPVWTAAYEKLDPDDEQELADLEASYKEEVDSVQEYNKLEKKKRGRRKAKNVLKAYPCTSDRLDELRARGADEAVSFSSSLFVLAVIFPCAYHSLMTANILLLGTNTLMIEIKALVFQQQNQGQSAQSGTVPCLAFTHHHLARPPPVASKCRGCCGRTRPTARRFECGTGRRMTRTLTKKTRI